MRSFRVLAPGLNSFLSHSSSGPWCWGFNWSVELSTFNVLSSVGSRDLGKWGSRERGSGRIKKDMYLKSRMKQIQWWIFSKKSHLRITKRDCGDGGRASLSCAALCGINAARNVILPEIRVWPVRVGTWSLELSHTVIIIKKLIAYISSLLSKKLKCLQVLPILLQMNIRNLMQNLAIVKKDYFEGLVFLSLRMHLHSSSHIWVRTWISGMDFGRSLIWTDWNKRYQHIPNCLTGYLTQHPSKFMWLTWLQNANNNVQDFQHREWLQIWLMCCPQNRSGLITVKNRWR